MEFIVSLKRQWLWFLFAFSKRWSIGNSFVGQTINDICKRRLSSEYYRRATAILELLMIKRGVLDVSECHFSGHDIDVTVDFICIA